MKNALCLACWLLAASFLPVFSKAPLSFSEKATLFDHLVEVNKEWLYQADLPAGLDKPVSFLSDAERVAAHLRLVEATLRNRPTGHLTAAQAANRLRHLDVLRQYWQRGLFPTNHYHPHRQPYFVDDFGVHCAVGYLLHRAGEDALVEKIRLENNYGYVAELVQQFPEIQDWGVENGFTVDELTWIQPAYQPEPQPLNVVGNGGGCNGRINVMKNHYVGLLVMAGSFTEVDGVPANSIIAWDGENWQTFGEGVDGEIFDIDVFSSTLYIAGKFSLFGQPEKQNLAYWDGSSWQGMQTGDMEGAVYAIRSLGSELFIGGDFKKIDGQPAHGLAFRKYHYQSQSFSWTNFENALAVDGTVRCLNYYDGHLLVGGDFSQTAFDCQNPAVNKLAVDHLAFWNKYDENWVSGLTGDYSPVLAMARKDGFLYVGGDLNQPPGFAILDGGLWIYPYLYPFGDGLVHGFMEHNNQLYVYGGLYFDPFFGAYGSGVFGLVTGGVILADSTIRAAASFKGQAYFAGDFTSIDGQPFNGLVSSPLDGLNPVQEPEQSAFVEVFSSGKTITLREKDLVHSATFSVYDLQGRQVAAAMLEPGFSEERINLENVPRGVLVYRISDGRRQASGKLMRY